MKSIPKTLEEVSGEATTLLRQDSSVISVYNPSNTRGAWEAIMANGCLGPAIRTQAKQLAGEQPLEDGNNNAVNEVEMIKQSGVSKVAI